MTPFEKATLPVNLPDYIADDAVVMNDVYQVNIRRFEAGGLGRIVHLSIKRRDKQACSAAVLSENAADRFLRDCSFPVVGFRLQADF